MRKLIRILEIPFYLLVIAAFAFELGYTISGILLILVSIGRLVINKNTEGYGK